MTVELDEVRSFLAEHEPFAHLPDATLDALPAKLKMTYVRRGEELLRMGEVNDTLYIIRSGAVDVVAEGDMLIDRRETGRNFGYSTLVGEPESSYRMVAVEDSLLLCMPRAVFTELVAENPDIARFFSTQSQRVRSAAKELSDDTSADALRTRVEELVDKRHVAQLGPEATIREAAQKMTEDRSTVLLIVDAGLKGIVTDTDMRKRVVAAGTDTSAPVTDIMTPEPRTIAPDMLAFEAMLAMSELGIHHLPVMEGERVVGVLNSSDILAQLQSDPIYLTADLAHSSAEELEGAYRRAAEVAVRFLDRGASASEAAKLLSSVADTIAARLFVLAEEKYGPAPVPYAFVAVGSQARREMGPASDQDNALVLADSFDPAQHDEYFAQITEFVCQGLHRAGQVLCPGDMMASNPEWRMTVSQWHSTFHNWITAPEAEALLNAQIFFDFRLIYGEQSLADVVHEQAVMHAKGSRRLHAHLAALAARREPPIGFFRGFVVERSGDYADTLDIKKGGTAAVVQMARLYAISAGVPEVDTRSRIQASAGKSISIKGAEDLLDAFDYLQNIAVRQQAQQMRRGEEPNYHIDPKALPSMERDSLRDAFGVIKGLQSALASKYPVRTI
ncbi:DUF294 nucleotidyltransferase-like domain-containing protein [Corynebacterium breve]|uniref:DUF294 nucleotidyltransferase-like domain-containing protein n=1 Tax=Corynebacterium breve TaxID=3049799 RepID=A0ABY8VMA4_9CORY|nr:DUF294 nucleotidyltransferase-like domain-containing protein [Corynebacterium breve]WIM68690.1 DUF294 nucleotidyltransferase-like domain-containing protein [Corynebacterium breve]